MEIIKNIIEGTLSLALIGRLDTNTAPALEAVIQNETDGISELIFDFAELEYISSAGLRILLTAQKKMNRQGSMKVKNVNECVMEILEITAFTDILTIE